MVLPRKLGLVARPESRLRRRLGAEASTVMTPLHMRESPPLHMRQCAVCFKEHVLVGEGVLVG